METDTFAYWGKAQGGEGIATHPLCWHLIDVGACAQALLDAQPLRHRALATVLSLPPAEARAWVGFMAALHDVGKLAIAFQRKAMTHVPAALAAFPPTGPECDHTVEGAALLHERPPGDIFTDAAQGAKLTNVVAGHHGRPVRDLFYREKTFGAPGLAAYGRIVEMLRAIFAPPCLPALDPAALEKALWRLAGLTTLADWLGSNRACFPYTPPCDPLLYARSAALQAREAVREAGLAAARGGMAEAAAFLPPGATPTPMQEAAETVPIRDDPALFVIEDATGSGKTEAAAILAARLIVAGRACGVFFALPTMATANAMFGRMRGGHRTFFAAGERPSLALAHGRADLNEAFAASLIAEGAQADCAAWFAGETRRALLADTGVGTIDQALLAALPSRFQALRLYGLADKVLVIDEVHAFDAYMMAGIERLLAFHARLGGSAILLSATLPGEMRTRLERAWTGTKSTVPDKAVLAAGMGAPAAPPSPAPEVVEDPLPLLSVVSPSGTGRIPVAAAAQRRVAVERLGSVAAGEARIVAAAAQGAACLYLRNSVDDAHETVSRLRETGVAATLFHARFAMADRLAIEADVLDTYGKEADASSRRGRVLVATQVVEQSLDLDFDVMVSDLAPLDLLIQRAGRLRRHGRAGRPVADAPFMVVSPDPDAVDAQWPRAMLPRTSAVYRDDTLLWRGARALFAAGEIATPQGARALVEAVYGADAEAAPPVLERREIETDGQGRAHRTIGAQTFLHPSNEYEWSRDPVTEGRAPTRLGEASVTLRLARWDGQTLTPWSGVAGRRGWALSEISVGPWVLTGVPEPAGALAGAVRGAKAAWGRWEAEEIALLPLEPRGAAWQGRALGPDGAESIVTYTPEEGLSRS